LKLIDISTIDISMKSENTDIRLLESFGRLRRALNLHFTQAVRPLGVGAKQAALIRYLARQGTASLAELSRFTLTDPAATTRAVNLLLKRGWVRQEEHPTDKRRWQMALTPQGEKQATRVEKTYEEIAGKISGSLTGAERKTFAKTLLKLNAVFSAEGSGGKPSKPSVMNDDSRRPV
jgi:DNA-binding MarR family transcriptional regulator